MQTVQLAGAFEDIGDHLLGIGTSWAEGGLKLVLLVLIVVKVSQRFSVKAGIGAVLGYVVILAIYGSQGSLAKAFQDEITSSGSAPASVVRVDGRGGDPLGLTPVRDVATSDERGGEGA
jgi:phosphotransferase system  glucose/maltose/N-acetylglucosamine-specific IIC component